MLAQLGANASQKNRKFKRFGHIVVGARFKAKYRIGIGVLGGQHDDGRFKAPVPELSNSITAIHIRKNDSHNQKFDMILPRRLHASSRIVFLTNMEFPAQLE